MKKKSIIITTVLIIFAAVAFYGYREYTRKNKDLINEKPAATLDAASLVAAYEKDTAHFDRTYTGKVIMVTGTVQKIDANENPVVIALGEEGSFSTVQCSMDSTHAELYRDVKEGASVRIKGMCTGGRSDEMFGTDVIINRAVIVNN